MTAAYTYAAAEQRAMRELERRGFGVIASPRSPRPDQLAVGQTIYDWPEAFDNRVGDDLLARWHLSLAAWLAYAEGQRGIAEAVRASAAHQRDAAKARALAVADGKITDRRALADADPATLEAGAVYAQAKARSELLAGQVEGIRARLMVVAQEVKRRSIAVGPQYRNDDGGRG